MNKRILLLLISLIFSQTIVFGQTNTLKEEFQNPPNSARPRVWWHWMNGNVTKEGIQKDLEWMKRVGIGGFQNFDASLFTPQVVKPRLVYMTPEWKDAFKFTTDLANQFGLEFKRRSPRLHFNSWKKNTVRIGCQTNT